MKLTTPKTTTFYIAAALGILGFLGYLIQIPFVSANAFFFLLVGFILLALSVLLKDL